MTETGPDGPITSTSGRFGVLSPAQLAAMTTLASGGTYVEAQEAAGVSGRTLRRWRASDAFSRALAEVREETVADARERLSAASGEAVRVLAGIAEDPAQPAAARVTAARTILTAALDRDLHDRLATLEESLT